MKVANTTDSPHVTVVPDAHRTKTYAVWIGLAGFAFFAVYPAANWFTELRAHRLHLFVVPELGIPFVPQFIWAYLSMYLLIPLPLFLLPDTQIPTLGKQLLTGTLVSGLLFLSLPADLGFERVVPSNPVYASLYTTIFGIDRPHNLVPSLHVIWSSAIILACIDVVRTSLQVLLYAWLVAIVISTVFVHQHHILDVVVAAILVYVLRRIYKVPHE